MHGTRDELVPLPPPFEIVLRGFDRRQVIEHVNALKTRVAALGAERDAALQRAAELNEALELLRHEASEATRQVDRLRREAQQTANELDRLQRSPLTAATARIKQMLQMAEDEAAELHAAAEHETTSLRESARAEADQLLTETQRRCERLEAASSGDRQLVEQQFERDIASRQAETDAWVSEYQTRSIAALYLLMQLAGERLNTRVDKVKRQVTAAKALRSEVTDQLSAVQRLLTEALGVVEVPTPAEQAELVAQAEPTGQAEPTLSIEPTLPIDTTLSIEPTLPIEPTRQAEPTDQTGPAEPSSGAPSQDPARSVARSRAAQQKERSGPASRSSRADDPTARFGLHP